MLIIFTRQKMPPHIGVSCYWKNYWFIPRNLRFQKAIDFMVGKTHQEIEERLQSSDSGFTCLWGKILRYVLYAGFIDDPRVSDLITYVSRSIYQKGMCMLY